MNKTNRTFLILPLLTALLPLAVVGEETLSTPAPTANFVNEAAILEVPAESNPFSIRFEPGGEAVEKVHAVLGYFGEEKPGFADVGYYPEPEGNPGGPSAAPSIVLGTGNNGHSGTIVWKLVFPSPLPAGSKASFDIVFIGRPFLQGDMFYVAVSDHFEANSKINGLNSPPAEQHYMVTDSDDHGTYEERIEVPLPEGASEAYLIVADAGTSARIALREIVLTIP